MTELKKINWVEKFKKLKEQKEKNKKDFFKFDEKK